MGKKSTSGHPPNAALRLGLRCLAVGAGMLWLNACGGPVIEEDAGPAEDATVLLDAAVDVDSGPGQDTYTPPLPGVITGLIENSDGQALAGVEIATEPSTGFAVSGSDGLYRIEGVSAATYTVVASHRDYLTARREGVELQAGGTAMVDFRLALLDTSGRIVGRVVDSVTGLAIAGANLLLQPGSLDTTSDVAGLYVFSGLNPGLYTIALSADGYENWTSELLQVQQRSDTTQDFSLVALPVYDSTCVACHIDTVRILADLEIDPLPDSEGESGSAGEG